eukprot:g5027.t1
MMKIALHKSQELIDAFNNACQGNVRYVQAIIENESIVLNATSAVSGTAEEDFNNTIAKEIADGKPRYYCFNEDGNGGEFILIAFVPEDSPVRQKMLYASCHKDVVNQLGKDKFKSEWYCNEAKEMIWAGINEQINHDETAAPLTEAEMFKKAELKSQATAEASTGVMTGLPFQPTSSLLEALNNFKSNDINFIEMNVGKKEELDLVNSEALSNDFDINSKINSEAGAFYIVRYPLDGGKTLIDTAASNAFFVFCCPDSVGVKDRMVLATVKSTAIQICQGVGVQFAKTMETTSPEDVISDIMAEVKTMTESRSLQNKVAFSKPKRPGRGKRRMMKKKPPT